MSKINGNVVRKYTTLFSSPGTEEIKTDAEEIEKSQEAEDDDMHDLLDELPEAVDAYVNRDPLEDYDWADHMAKIFSALPKLEHQKSVSVLPKTRREKYTGIPANTTYADSTGVTIDDKGDDSEFGNIPALERARHMKSHGWLNLIVATIPLLIAGYVLVKCMEEVISD